MKSIPIQFTHRVPVWFSVAIRVAYGALLVLLSIYCLLAYLPDTYFAYIQAPYQPWLTWLIRFHPYLYAAILALLSLALVGENSAGRSRRHALEFAAMQAALAVFFVVVRPVSHLGNNSLSYIWSVVLLVPVLLLATVDYSAGWSSRSSPGAVASLEFVPLLLVAAVISILYPGMGFLRALQGGIPFRLTALDCQAWLAAIVAHLLFCAFLVSLFNLAGSLSNKFSRALSLRFFLYNLLAWFVLDRVFQNVLLATVPFYSLASQIYSATIALALVMLGGSLHLRLKQWRRDTSGLRQKPESRLLPAALGLVLLAAAYVVPAFIGVVDWNFLLEKMWVLVLWTGAFAVVVRWGQVRSPKSYSVRGLLAIAICTPLTYHYLVAQPTVQAASPPTKEMDDAMGRHSYFDASFQVVRDIWFSPQQKPCDDLCQFLLTQTNLPPTAKVTPVELGLVEHLSAASQPKPNIFIFVVDSLRQDYVSAYNPAVRFTPEIGRFAADSTVLLNSFTRYAGTTLAEPSIWSGAMLAHKHYIQPFHPVNSLERLLDTDGYQRLISVDTVLQVLLRSTPDLVRLDTNVKQWTDEDLCSTVGDAENKISRFHDRSRPLFLYAQPQNVHGATLGKLGADRAPKKPYPGFHALTASEIERLDGCFGSFLGYLKATGVYDNSIIVLTADHGDSFGEFGHKGHALELTPSVLRIPLIIHLPPALRKNYYADPDQVAFNIDITPTLYYLLGHRPIVNDERFGKPLFTANREEAAAHLHHEYLVASSYGAVYGLIGHDGRTLFVANAVEGTNQYFDLAKDPGAVVNRINDQLLATEQQRMRAHVQQIADLYHFQYHPPTLKDWLMH